MSFLIVLAISAILAAVYIYWSKHAEGQRQKSQQETRSDERKPSVEAGQ